MRSSKGIRKRANIWVPFFHIFVLHCVCVCSGWILLILMSSLTCIESLLRWWDSSRAKETRNGCAIREGRASIYEIVVGLMFLFLLSLFFFFLSFYFRYFLPETTTHNDGRKREKKDSSILGAVTKILPSSWVPWLYETRWIFAENSQPPGIPLLSMCQLPSNDLCILYMYMYITTTRLFALLMFRFSPCL